MQLYCFRSDLVFHCCALWYMTELEASLKVSAITLHCATNLDLSQSICSTHIFFCCCFHLSFL